MTITNEKEGKAAKKAGVKKLNSKTQQPSTPSDLAPLQLKELTEMLIKHYGLKNGLYDLLIEFQIGLGGVASANGTDQLLPGAIVGISRIGLHKVESPTAQTIDASKVK
jgi:hypothetical protein